MTRIFDWPWMTGVSIVIAIAMVLLVRASYQRRIKRVQRLGTRQLVMRLVPLGALRLPSARATRLGVATLLCRDRDGRTALGRGGDDPSW
jgi:hypothetical protein